MLHQEEVSQVQLNATAAQDTGIKIPGVIPLTLDNSIQKILHCIAGEHVTTESPWTYIQKECVISIDIPEFLAIKEDLLNFPGDQFLIGYDAAPESANQYFLCSTLDAQKTVLDILEKTKQELEKKIQNAINKRVKTWRPLGSQVEVDESIPKNNRPLFEVELETTIDELRLPTLFTERNVNAIKDGYQECTHHREPIINIQKKRISIGVQACPIVRSCEAQTNPGLPSNVWTQYEYDVDLTGRALQDPQLAQAVKYFLGKKEAPMRDAILYNTSFDLHKSDYPLPIDKIDGEKIQDAIIFEDYQTLLDPKRANGKYITSADWNPLRSGIVAVAYAMKRTEERVIQIEEEFVKNEVLIWSLTDTLKPKLVLESSSEVHSLKFCPYDENKLIGGCQNGQLILWDISDKLDETMGKAELIDLRENHKNPLGLKIGRGDGIKHGIKVLPTAISSPTHSHAFGFIPRLHWLEPKIRITKNGEITIIDRDEKKESLQLMTCSEDGLINIWDFSPTLDETSTQPENCALLPQFSLKATYPEGKDPLLLSSIGLKSTRIKYFLAPGQSKAVQITDQRIYKPMIPVYSDKDKLEDIAMELHIGTALGGIFSAKWGPYQPPNEDDLDSDDPEYNLLPVQHKCIFHPLQSIHDGPVTSVSRSEYLKDTFLSIGGRSLAVWWEDYQQSPVFVRRSTVTLTAVAWSAHRPTMFYIGREDGTLQVWDLIQNSGKPIYERPISNVAITGIYFHKLYLPSKLLGITDYNGLFKILYVPVQFTQRISNDEAKLYKMFKDENLRREEMDEWQQHWRKANAEKLRIQKQLTVRVVKLRRDAEEKKKELERVKEKISIKELEKLKIHTIPTNLTDPAQMAWDKKQAEIMTKILMDKKKLDKEDLVAKQLPVLVLKQEEQDKAQKLIERVKIFEKTLDDSMKALLPEPPDVLQGEPAAKLPLPSEILSQYAKLAAEKSNYIDTYKLIRQVKLSEVLKEGRARKDILDKHARLQKKLALKSS